MSESDRRPSRRSPDLRAGTPAQRGAGDAVPDPGNHESDSCALVGDASVAILVVSAAGSILQGNRAAHELVGVSPGDLQDKPLSDLVRRAESAHIVDAQPEDSGDQAVSRRLETELLLQDGGELPVEISAVPVRWKGQLASALFIRDLSALRRADRALHESEDRWRAIASVFPDQVFVLDEDGRCVEALGTRQELLHVPVGSLKGRLIQEVLPADAAQALLRAVRRTIEEGSTRSLEYAHRYEGGEIWFEGRTALLRSAIDGKRCVVWIARDITERKNAERVRDHQHQFVRDLLNAIPNPVFAKDGEHRFLVLNDALCAFVGRTRDELLGRSDFDFFPEDEARWFVEKDSEVLASGRPNEVEESLTTASGERRWILTRKTAGTGPDGEPILIGSFSDLTERRRVEEELRRRDRILEAMNLAAEHLLGSKLWTESIDEIVAILGMATEASRILFYRNLPGAEGEFRAQAMARWADPAHHPTMEPDQEIITRTVGTPVWSWVEALRQGQVLCRAVEDYPGSLQGRNWAEGARILVMVPIIAAEQWWGTLLLIDCTGERAWAAGELEALRLSGTVLGAAIHRQQVAEALQESEEKYRTLVEGADQGIVILDRSGRFIFANGSITTDMGLSAADVIGRTVWDVSPPEYAEPLMDGVREAISAGAPTVRQVRRPSRERDRWYEARIQPVREADGVCRRALIILTDMTQRKEAEDRVLSYQEQLRSLTVELALTEQRERKRLASELHDGIGQTLAASKIKLGALKKSARHGVDAKLIDEVWQLIDQTIQDTRTLTFQLSPPILHELGLEPALEWLAETFRARYGIDITFDDDGQRKPLGPDLSGLLFQSAQELLINAAKHGQPSHVRVSCRRAGEQILIEVEDDGGGFEPAQIDAAGQNPHGFGLFSIRERLGPLGGDMQVRSSTGQGTSILLSVPLRESGEDQVGGDEKDNAVS